MKGFMAPASEARTLNLALAPTSNHGVNVLAMLYIYTHAWECLRAISHTRLRARDHYTSSTLIGGTGGAGPSSLHTTLEGPTEYVNARWM